MHAILNKYLKLNSQKPMPSAQNALKFQPNARNIFNRPAVKKSNEKTIVVSERND